MFTTGITVQGSLAESEALNDWLRDHHDWEDEGGSVLLPEHGNPAYADPESDWEIIERALGGDRHGRGS